MIDLKYQLLYNKFITHYKNVHINPWHEIDEEKLCGIYNSIVEKMDITNDFEFCYLMNYCIKRLSGESDAHTMFTMKTVKPLPFGFKMIGENLYAYRPNTLRGAKLVSINGIDIEKVIYEIEDVITYGTDGRRRLQIENTLKYDLSLFSLPCFLKQNRVEFEVLDLNGEPQKLVYEKNQKTEHNFNFEDKNATYKIVGDTLVYNHSSVQRNYEEKINNAVANLYNQNLEDINKIIVDLRGNTGGDSRLNKPLIDFLKTQKDKQLVALTDYQVFSGGRYALVDLIKLGAITVGEEISTPLNCYGNCEWLDAGDYHFSASRSYLYPNLQKSVEYHTKQDFKNGATDKLLEPKIFKPDVLIERSVQDFIDKKDVIMETALVLDVNEIKK